MERGRPVALQQMKSCNSTTAFVVYWLRDFSEPVTYPSMLKSPTNTHRPTPYSLACSLSVCLAAVAVLNRKKKKDGFHKRQQDINRDIWDVECTNEEREGEEKR
ncbi:hypothetical protein BIW11_02610 [Tropilaelaps mercedesae]|uniref:Uncharacterized protein n=1 Tax=Tropilaelaps mercedesae TaxID=418985 RepID=A0A1V9Y067_9ACAR|nr:hypothetical protein BIW11_02610 [Tropilaelaps mercedesae]